MSGCRGHEQCEQIPHYGKCFDAAIEKALAEDKSERIAARRKMVEKATWDCKAELLLDELFRNSIS